MLSFPRAFGHGCPASGIGRPRGEAPQRTTTRWTADSHDEVVPNRRGRSEGERWPRPRVKRDRRTDLQLSSSVPDSWRGRRVCQHTPLPVAPRNAAAVGGNGVFGHHPPRLYRDRHWRLSAHETIQALTPLPTMVVYGPHAGGGRLVRAESDPRRLRAHHAWDGAAWDVETATSPALWEAEDVTGSPGDAAVTASGL